MFIPWNKHDFENEWDICQQNPSLKIYLSQEITGLYTNFHQSTLIKPISINRLSIKAKKKKHNSLPGFRQCLSSSNSKKKTVTNSELENNLAKHSENNQFPKKNILYKLIK